MKTFAAIILALVAPFAYGASCCVGGSPKTFIQLRRLQTYEVGLSTSVRDTYGRYNLYGERETTAGDQTYTVAWGIGARLTEKAQIFSVLPLVHQISRYGATSVSHTSPGDALVGGTWAVVEQLFFDDWYPTVALTAGAKLPTGKVETVRAGRRVPGTGNGLWEPFVGLSLRKDFEWVTFSFSANFSRPFGKLEGDISEGNRWELSEALNVPFGRRFSFGGGLAQIWVGNKRQGGLVLADSAERSSGAFLTSTYFVTPLVDLTLTADSSLPANGLSVNYAAYRSLTFTVKYGFY